MSKKILVVSSEEDCSIIEKMLSDGEYRITGVKSVNEMKIPSREPPPVIICEACTPDGGNWKQVLEAAQEMNGQPLVIVCSEHADEHLWAEVLNLGAYDVLVKPFEKEEVARVVEFAVIRKSQ